MILVMVIVVIIVNPNGYVDDATTINNGILSLTAKYQCVANDGSRSDVYSPYNCATYPYTSGLISSVKSFTQKYGYFEARVKLPNAQGTWPAFWLLPYPAGANVGSTWPLAFQYWPPEVDIMEAKGRLVNDLYQTNIWGAAYPDPGSANNDWAWGDMNQYIYHGPADYTAGFHTIGLDWQPGYMTWSCGRSSNKFS